MSEIGLYTPAPDRQTSMEECAAINAFQRGLLQHGHTTKFYNHGEPCDAPVAVMFGWGKLRHAEVVAHQKVIGGRVLGINFGAIRRDLGYCVAGWDGLNNAGQYYNQDSPSDRWNRLGMEIKPWRKNLGHVGPVVLTCQVPTDGSVQAVDIIDWCRKTAVEIRQRTDREIIFRPHPLARDITPLIEGTTRSERSFMEDLQGAWAVVTYNSTSSGLAVLEGVPVFCFDQQSIAWDVASHDLGLLPDPVLKDRTQWAYNLAYTQWTLEEMKIGQAWEHLKQGVPV